jgi:hypothetical protein
MSSIPANVVEDIDSEEGHAAGAIELRLAYRGKGVAGIGFRCPCGCGAEGYLPIRMKGTARTETPEWEWDGDEKKPALSPSVFNSGLPCKWHGWLRSGEWTSA